MKHLQDAINHAKQCYPHESCGFFIIKKGKLTYFPCENLAKNTDEEFMIGVEDYDRAEQIGEIHTIVHSHPDASCEPSVADLQAHKITALEWLIIGLNQGKETLKYLKPSSQQILLYGRPFLHGMNDCYGFIRDWYKQELNISLQDFNRQDQWWEKGEDLYIENFKKAGFVEVEDLQVGDVLLMQINSNVANHGAIYLGDGLIGHHLYNRLSSKDVYGQFYRQRTVKIVRYSQN